MIENNVIINQGHRALKQATEGRFILPAGQPRRGQGGEGGAALLGCKGGDTLLVREGPERRREFQGEKQTSFFLSMAVGFSDSDSQLCMWFIEEPSSTEPNLFHHRETTYRVG